jgi:hypothetical protein
LQNKIYSTTIGVSGTKDELIEIFDKYSLDEFSEFYHSIMDTDLKDTLREYFKKRMRNSMGLE